MKLDAQQRFDATCDLSFELRQFLAQKIEDKNLPPSVVVGAALSVLLRVISCLGQPQSRIEAAEACSRALYKVAADTFPSNEEN